MICKFCRTLISDESSFCPVCGKNLTVCTEAEKASPVKLGRAYLYNALFPGLGHIYAGSYFLGHFYVFLGFIFYILFFKSSSGASSFMENQIIHLQLFIIAGLSLILLYARVLYGTKKIVRVSGKPNAYKKVLVLVFQIIVIVSLSVLTAL